MNARRSNHGGAREGVALLRLENRVALGYRDSVIMLESNSRRCVSQER
jgi:hypothetical protein